MKSILASASWDKTVRLWDMFDSWRTKETLALTSDGEHEAAGRSSSLGTSSMLSHPLPCYWLWVWCEPSGGKQGVAFNPDLLVWRPLRLAVPRRQQIGESGQRGFHESLWGSRSVGKYARQERTAPRG